MWQLNKTFQTDAGLITEYTLSPEGLDAVRKYNLHAYPGVMPDDNEVELEQYSDYSPQLGSLGFSFSADRRTCLSFSFPSYEYLKVQCEKQELEFKIEKVSGLATSEFFFEKFSDNITLWSDDVEFLHDAWFHVIPAMIRSIQKKAGHKLEIDARDAAITEAFVHQSLNRYRSYTDIAPIDAQEKLQLEYSLGVFADSTQPAMKEFGILPSVRDMLGQFVADPYNSEAWIGAIKRNAQTNVADLLSLWDKIYLSVSYRHPVTEGEAVDLLKSCKDYTYCISKLASGQLKFNIKVNEAQTKQFNLSIDETESKGFKFIITLSDTPFRVELETTDGKIDPTCLRLIAKGAENSPASDKVRLFSSGSADIIHAASAGWLTEDPCTAAKLALECHI